MKLFEFSRARRSKRYVQVFWTNNTALLDSDYTDSFRNEPGTGLTRRVNGKLLVEIPLTTRHVGEVTYGYQVTSPQNSPVKKETGKIPIERLCVFIFVHNEIFSEFLTFFDLDNWAQVPFNLPNKTCQNLFEIL